MNNLILALLAITFAVVLVFAGVSYLERTSVTRVTVATDGVADVEQMMADYQNLRINLGRRPTGSDYSAVYAGQSTNSTYNYANANAPVRPTSLLGAVALDSTVTQPGWTYAPGCGGSNPSNDCFYLKLNPGAAQQTLAYQAAQLAATKETDGKGTSQITLYAGTGASCTTTAGCSGTAYTNPATWPATAPSTPYFLSVSIAAATPQETGSTYVAGCACTYGDSSYACGATWNGITSTPQPCPSGATGTEEDATTTTPYICAGDNNPQAHGSSTLNQPTDYCSECGSAVDTCAYGSYSNPGTNSGNNSVSWICTSSNSQTTTNCSYTCPSGTTAYNGTCQPDAACNDAAIGGCSPGSNSTPTDTGLTTIGWSCSEPYGPVASGCSFTCASGQIAQGGNCVASVGVCGSANGVTTSTTPTSGLCSTGNASAVSVSSNTYDWSCTGLNGGTVVNCSAPERINGACGTACGVATTSAPATGLCSAGNASTVSLSGNTWQWMCAGINGGASAPGSAPEEVNGVCGSACGVATLTAPTSGLCSSGNASAVSLNGNTWQWTCAGINSGSSVPGSAPQIVDGACGSACGVAIVNAPTSGLCSAGNASAVSLSGTTWEWACAGINGGTSAPGSAPEEINGACGSANNAQDGSQPWNNNASNLCSAGTPANGAFANNTWTWTCNGANSGSTADCSAPQYYTATCAQGGLGGNGTIYSGANGWSSWSSAPGCCYPGQPSDQTFSDGGATGIPGCDAPPQCGSANGSEDPNVPWQDGNYGNLCAAGTPNNGGFSNNTWTWTCGVGDQSVNCAEAQYYTASCAAGGLSGSGTIEYDNSGWVSTSGCCWAGHLNDASYNLNGAQTPGCDAPPVCGSDNNVQDANAPWNGATASGLCGTGAAGSGNGAFANNQWTWTCSVDGATVNCQAPQYYTATCAQGGLGGNGTIYSAANGWAGGWSSAPGCCVNGQPSDQTFNEAGANVPGCDAPPSCGSANGSEDPNVPWQDGNYGNLCAAGTPGNGGNSGDQWTWTCAVGDQSVNCSETQYYTASCAAGSLTGSGTIEYDNSGWVSTTGCCYPGGLNDASYNLNGAMTPGCDAPPVCGSDNNVQDANAPWNGATANGLCGTGAAGSGNGAFANNTWTWTCSVDGATVNCQAPQYYTATCQQGGLGGNGTIYSGANGWSSWSSAPGCCDLNGFTDKSYPEYSGVVVPGCNVPTYSWSGWSGCSASCGGGTETRSCNGTDGSTNNPASDCGGGSAQRACNTQACVSYSWSGWSSCSASCGGGTQTRSCNGSDNSTNNPASDCGGGSAQQACNTQACVSYSWSGWSSCSASCGGGTQTRSCNGSDNSTNNPASDCGGGSAQQACNTQACVTPACGSTQYSCSSGTVVAASENDTSGTSTWTCEGTGSPIPTQACSLCDTGYTMYNGACVSTTTCPGGSWPVGPSPYYSSSDPYGFAGRVPSASVGTVTSLSGASCTWVPQCGVVRAACVNSTPGTYDGLGTMPVVPGAPAVWAIYIISPWDGTVAETVVGNPPNP